MNWKYFLKYDKHKTQIFYFNILIFLIMKLYFKNDKQINWIFKSDFVFSKGYLIKKFNKKNFIYKLHIHNILYKTKLLLILIT